MMLMKEILIPIPFLFTCERIDSGSVYHKSYSNLIVILTHMKPSYTEIYNKNMNRVYELTEGNKNMGVPRY